MKLLVVRRWMVLLGLLLSTYPAIVNAQLDNFDSYSSVEEFTAAGWRLSALAPGLVTTSFPDVGNGKGLRIQANPVPDAAPAVGLWYRPEEFTDFHMAIDIVDWPGTDKNQAMVLFARMTDANTGAAPDEDFNPAAAQGMICNYDASQYGEAPGDRRQGQFQINRVSAGFETVTLAAAEITFVPGRSYRMIFRGEGIVFTAQVYDLHDLTAPLVTLQVEDATYAGGACGFLSFSREDTTGTTDVTFDNYYAGTADPNAAPAPALSHPVAGTPQVVTRTPTNRFAHFYPASNGIQFTAQTFSDNTINAAATKLFLNGVDVSSALAPFPADGSSVSFSTAPGTLASNTVYSARIELVDTTGTARSTNTFWFDTFSEAYLTNPPAKTIEAEDYNFGGGQFQTDPIPVSGLNSAFQQVNGNGDGYFDLEGVPEVDYHDNGTQPGSGETPEYRSLDFVGTQQGQVEIEIDGLDPVRLNDIPRSPYAAVDVAEYQVRRFDPGEWLNYTRVFEPGNYQAYLRVGSFGETTVRLDRVTSDPTQPDQTTEPLGTFTIPNMFMRSNYRYIPLTDANGNPAVLSLGGTNTLRLTSTGTEGQDARKINPNYILFVPAGGSSPGDLILESASVVTGPYSEAAGASVDAQTRTVTVPVSGSMTFYRIRSGSAVRITGIRLSGDSAIMTYE